MIAEVCARWRGGWGELEVWRFPCEQEVGALADALDADERARAARFVARVHRDRYVAQHAVMRALLATYAGGAAGELRFGRGARGKPFVVGAGGDVRFNLSHCDDVALLAVARGVEVGCDVERLDARIEPAELASRVLAVGERALVSRPEFFRVWCRKEACLKAVGVGLVDDLTAIDVRAEVVEVEGASVAVRDLDVGGAHAAAIAVVTG
nr:4'-phosphopantetheinyl transferase superfamily protein [Kofleriaceae bacterium]